MSSSGENQEAPLPESPVMTQREAAAYPLPASSGGTNPDEGNVATDYQPMTQREAAAYPLPASSGGTSPDEGSYTTPVDLSISTTPEIIDQGGTTKYYFGNRDFITLSIFALERPETTFVGKGTYGKTYRIKRYGNYFYVKSVLIERKGRYIDPARFRRTFDALEREILTNIELTNTSITRDYVSNIKGAYLSRSETAVQAYLIFEAPNGLVLSELIKILPPEINRYKYSRLYCMIKRAQNALNTLGYVHSDIKPANIYVLIEGDILRGGRILGCKLIDFGLTKTIGDAFFGDGTPFYTPHDMILDNPTRTRMGIPFLTPKYRGTVTTRHNDYSVDVIWKEDFRMGDDPTPYCGSADMAGGRYRKKSRKTRKSKKSKTRKSKTRSRSS
jgi:hypothetical protein